MANTPRKKHAKQTRKPVTIDLAATPEEPVPAKAGPAAPPPAEPVAFAKPAVDFDALAEAAAGDTVDEKDATRETAANGNGHDTRTSPTAGPAVAPAARGSSSAVTGGLIGGALALLLAGTAQWAGLLPSPGIAPAETPAEVIALQDRLASLESQLAASMPAANNDALTGEVENLKARVAEVETGLTTLRDAPTAPAADMPDIEPLQNRLAALETRIGELAAAPVGDGASAGNAPDASELAALRSRIESLVGEVASTANAARDTAAAAETNTAAQAEIRRGLEAATGAIAALDGRVAAAEEQVTKLGERPDAAVPIAAAALKSAIDRGSGFAAELETYAQVTGDAETVEALRADAAAGVPTIAQLQQRFSQAADAMLAALDAPPGEGVMSRLLDSAKGLVKVRPVGDVEGDTPQAAVARMEARLNAGNLEAALTEYETLPDAAKQAGAEFVSALKARLAVDTLVAGKLNAALSGAGNPGN